MVAFADALGRHLRAVNAQLFVHRGEPADFPTIELVFDGLRFYLHTAPSGALQPVEEPLEAYSMPELDAEMKVEDWSSRPGYRDAIGAQLVRVGQMVDNETICGAIMHFANGAELYFVNWGDELWASSTLPPASVLDGMTVRD